MKDKIIEIEKSRTIETGGLLGRTAYKKCRMLLRSELEDGDNYEECENKVDKRIEDYFAQEKDRIINEAKSLANDKVKF
jgi:hypothetical protein